MEATDSFKALLNQTSSAEDLDLCELFATHLQAHGWRVARTEGDLRELALEQTDLVEPE